MASPSSATPFSPAEVRPKPQLGAARITLLVVAAAAPLTAMVGNMPIALALPGALGVPAAFLLTVLLLLCFSVGYAAMSRRIVSTGAFYTYVGQGLGKPAAVVAAYVAILAYGSMAIGLVAGFGYFASLILAQVGLGAPWLACMAVGVGVIGTLGYRSIDLSAKVLTVLITAEFGILAAFDLLVVLHQGPHAFPLAVWRPANVFTVSLGAAIPFAVVSFTGFESAALYGEDSRDPVRCVPRATYASLLLIGAFYLATVWIMIGAVGPDAVRGAAQAAGGQFLFGLTERFGGPVLTSLTGVFFITSMLATMLAIHNAVSRYLFAVARDGLLAPWLAAYHPHHRSPHRASLLMTAVELAVVGGLGLAGFSPYLGIASGMIGLGTIGILLLQVGAAIAIFAHLRRVQPRSPTPYLSLLGGMGLLVGVVLTVANYSRLIGNADPVADMLPALYGVVAVAALGLAWRLRRRNPAALRKVARSIRRPVAERRAVAVRSYPDRYCIVGAGPCGLIMARALLKEGIPFDCFEMHSDVGGIWELDRDGTPMYESAHFISSKWTSYFYGFPMPADYPDYPSHRQILDYIRDFARTFDLYRHIRFNTRVERATPDGDGWLVELATGEHRRYAGVICAPGVTWHARLPDLPGMDTFSGDIRHSVTYRSTAELRGKRVLIVGGGNSGIDIACDAARAADAAYLSLRRGYRFVPKHMFGVPTDLLFSGSIAPPAGVSLSGDANKILDTVNGDLTRLGLPKPDHDALASHPIMNTQILHYLAHGDISVTPDVTGFAGDEVIFADGSRRSADLVLFCTGYDYRLPFLDETLFTWKAGKPQLYLNVIHRELDGLYALGFAEFASAGYRRFDEMAQLVVADIHARTTGQGDAAMRRRRREDATDLRGGKTYVDSPRHANYVDADTYMEVLAGIRDELGWPDLDDRAFDAMRRHAGPDEAVRLEGQTAA